MGYGPWGPKESDMTGQVCMLGACMHFYRHLSTNSNFQLHWLNTKEHNCWVTCYV